MQPRSFPQPGGPKSRIPRTCFPPIFSTTSGGKIRDAKARRKISLNSSSRPPMPTLKILKFSNRKKFSKILGVVSPPIAYTQPTHLIWYCKRFLQYLLLYKKSKVWVVRRRRYGHFTTERTKNKMAISPPTHNPRT